MTLWRVVVEKYWVHHSYGLRAKILCGTAGSMKGFVSTIDIRGRTAKFVIPAQASARRFSLKAGIQIGPLVFKTA